MNATLTYNGDRALLVANDEAATRWLKRHGGAYRRHDVNGQLAVSGQRDAVASLSRRLASEGCNVYIRPLAA